MKYASIDIGTNTLRLLIAEVDANGALAPLVYRRAITRLGGNYTPEKGIDAASAERTFSALTDFRCAIDEVGVEIVEASATSVVRRSGNRDWFLGEVKRRTGLDVRVITGDEEARLSLLGVLSVLHDNSPRRLVMDIGGGSTEFIMTDDGAFKGAWSLDMGVVHLTERLLRADPPSEKEIASLEAEVKGVIRGLMADIKAKGLDPGAFTADNDCVFVGTAGTITTLAAIDQGLDVYDRTRINNYTLTKARVRHIYEYLLGLTLEQRHGVLNLERGREDLIIPGSAITLTAMNEFGFDSVKVSDAGLLEGLILDMAGALAGAKTKAEADTHG